MSFTILEVPFHLGLESVAVGRGPAKWVEAGADRVLSNAGEPAQVLHVRKRDETTTGLDAVVDINRQLRTAVRRAVAENVLPVALCGNCNSCLGILAALGPEETGVVWLDAHGDFNTPETSISGLLEGMSLAMAVGHCQQELLERIGYEGAVREENVVLLGTRDLDPGERERLNRSPIALDTGRFAELKSRVDRVYLHIDVDILDPEESPGTNFRAPGGLSVREVTALIRRVMTELPVAAIALTNYNPDHDPDGLTTRAGLRLLEALL